MSKIQADARTHTRCATTVSDVAGVEARIKECSFAIAQTPKERLCARTERFEIPPNRTACITLPCISSDAPLYSVIADDELGALVHYLSMTTDGKVSVVIDNCTTSMRRVCVAYTE